MDKTAKGKIRLLIAVLLLLILYCGTGKVVKSYRLCVGFPSYGTLTYNDIVMRCGKPTDIKIIKLPASKRYKITTTHSNLIKGKMQFTFYADNDEQLEDKNAWFLSMIKTYNPRHRFGWRGIHVGSTRDEVIRAYKRATRVTDYPLLGDSYFDRDWCYSVIFTYDKNDVVTSIEFVYFL